MSVASVAVCSKAVTHRLSVVVDSLFIVVFINCGVFVFGNSFLYST